MAYYSANPSSTTVASSIPPGPPDLQTPEDEPFTEEEEEEAITGVIQPGKRITLSKRTYLLFAFIVVTILSIAATVYTTLFYLDEYDFPPTPSSKDALENTMFALIALTIVTPVGFVILKFRVTNLVIGVLYLFLLVICLVFPAKGIAYSVYSLTQDTEFNIHLFAKGSGNKLHNFWSAFQKQKPCCGTKDIDRVEDWSYFINSSDFPASCCTKEQLKKASDYTKKNKKADSKRSPKPEMDQETNFCGKGMARTRTRGMGFGTTEIFKRIQSGFYLSLSDEVRGKMLLAWLDKTPAVYAIDKASMLIRMFHAFRKKKDGDYENLKPDVVFQRIWGNFYIDSVCNTADEMNNYDSTKKCKADNVKPLSKSNDLSHPHSMEYYDLVNRQVGILLDNKLPIDACVEWVKATDDHVFKDKKQPGRLPKETTPEEYCNRIFPPTRENVTTFGRILLLQFDYLTSYIYELGIPDGAATGISMGTWMLWSIPLHHEDNETYPHKLSANLYRANEKKMYYLSHGITENLILEGLIHKKTCEFVDNDEDYLAGMREKVGRDLNKRWRKGGSYSEWKNQKEGLGQFFLSELRKIVYISLSVASACIVCVIILAIVFWQYYSRIKAEEYANLALPKEFEVLHLRRGSLLDDEDIARDIRINRARRLAARKSHLNRVAPTRRIPRPGQQSLAPPGAPFWQQQQFPLNQGHPQDFAPYNMHQQQGPPQHNFHQQQGPPPHNFHQQQGPPPHNFHPQQGPPPHNFHQQEPIPPHYAHQQGNIPHNIHGHPEHAAHNMHPQHPQHSQHPQHAGHLQGHPHGQAGPHPGPPF